MKYLSKFFYLQLCICIALLWTAAGCSKGTDNSREEADLNVSRKLAVVSPAFLSPEMQQRHQSSHQFTIEIAKDGAGVVYVEPVKDKFRVVHNGKPGKPYFDISELSISSDGRRLAYVAHINDHLNKLVVDGVEGFPFGANDNHLFTPDGKRHLSTVAKDNKKLIVIDGKVYNDYDIYDMPLISPDSGSIAFSAKKPAGDKKQFIISEITLQNKTVFDDCGEYILPSEGNARLAVGCVEGGTNKVKVIDFTDRKVISQSEVNGTITHMKFSADSKSLLYTVVRDKQQRYVIYNGREEKIPDGDEFMTDPAPLSEPESVGVVIGDAFKVRLYRAFQQQKKNGKEYGYISDLVSSKDGRHYAYIATKPNEFQMQIVVDGSEGPKFDRIVSPLFSPDGRFLVYRARQAGKRFVVVSDLKGKIIRQHKEYSMVFQTIFTPDGKSVAYGVLDGNELWWKVEKL
ncbi:MAG: hypothetical protein AB1306_02050 [Nitrospirota bacterium]